MAEDQKKLQELSDAYQKLQTGTASFRLRTSKPTQQLISHPDLQATITARQRLESQQQENKGVQKVSCSPSPPHLQALPNPLTNH